MIKSFLSRNFHYHKRFLIHYLIILVATPLLAFLLYSLLPAKVNAAVPTALPLDQAVVIDVWGTVNNASLQLKLSPYDAFKTNAENSLLIHNKIKIRPKTIFKPNTTYHVTLEIKNFLGFKSLKTFVFSTGSLPKVVSASPALGSGSIPATSSLQFKLSSTLKAGKFVFTSDPPFDFTQKQTSNLLTITPKAKLIQGQAYSTKLAFSDPAVGTASLYSGDFKTTAPLEITAINPTDQATSVLKQTPLLITFNKPVTRNSLEINFQITPPINGNFNWTDDQNVTFTPSANWQTETKYTLTLPENIQSQDKAQLDQTNTFTFTTAGPVKLVNFSPSGSYYPINSAVVMIFDQPVDASSAHEHFSITPAVGGTFSYNVNTLVFHPSALSLLTNYKITLASGLKTVGGEDSNQNFTFNFTTTSERVTTIGNSVKGRAIKAYYFGTGAKKILLVGAIHGNESNTATMLNSWISFLRANQSAIDGDRTFIIVPYANPDGTAANNRFNANGVDLNRNWDLPDWQTVSYWQDRTYPTGGGTAPFSEPETKALSNLIISENPVVIVTYHASGNLVIGGDASNSFATWYSGLSGYGLSTGTSSETEDCQSVVGYCVTGTLEEWAGKRGNPTIVVEFASMTNSEYSKNLPALKGLLTLAI